MLNGSFVTDRYSLHPGPGGPGGHKRNQICSIEHLTGLTGVTFLAVKTRGGEENL